MLPCIETKARLAEQRDRDYSLVLDLTGFILGFIPGLLVLFLVSVRPKARAGKYPAYACEEDHVAL